MKPWSSSTWSRRTVHDFDTTLGTFGHPRYEIVPTGDVFDGEAEVMAYFEESRTAFPDQRNELVKMHHAEESVVVEFDLLGTHDGNFRGLPATGREFVCRTLAIFEFEDGTDRIVCERVYFDSATILRQLGIAHDPLTLTRAARDRRRTTRSPSGRRSRAACCVARRSSCPRSRAR